MNYTLWRTVLFVLLITIFSTPVFSGNNPCSATSIPNNMNDFQTFSNAGNTDSGVPAPDCGNYVSADFWFSVTVPNSGIINIATLSGGMTDGAMAIYDGPCSNPNELYCTEDDNCGNTNMPVMNLTGLNPGDVLFIRIWAQFGAPNGTFEIRVSDGPIGPLPLPTTETVGTADYTSEDCVQLTTTGTGQSGCAWDPVQINLNQAYDETFVFNFGTNDAGADGICWVFHDNPSGTGTCGGTGQNIAANFGNSFIVEFDTYDNGSGFSDIPNDHVSVNVNGNMGAAINGPFDLGNIEDGQDHEIRFVWTPGSNAYEIYFDGALTLTGNYDIITNCLGGNPNCYWGFTGSTGGAVNNQSVCPVDVTEYPAGSQVTIDVEICEGESYYAGGANQTTSGFYTDTYSAANGCDSIINTDLLVSPESIFEYDAALCQGFCETVGNETFCSSGTYEVLFANGAANGCDSIVTLNLTILDPIAVAFPPAPITCFSPSVLIDASPSTSSPGNVTYSWTGPSPDCFLSGQNTTTPVVNCSGTYTMVLIQMLNGTICSATTTVDVIDASAEPEAEAGPDQNLDCNSSCVVLNSEGSDSGPSYGITWTGPNNFVSNDPYPLVCVEGVYMLTILNLSTGCVATDQVTVSGNSNPPDVSATVSGLITCEDVEVTLDGSGSNGNGNLDFEWYNENNDSIGSDAQIDVNTTGTYTLVITDESNGCTADTMIVVGENTNEPTAIAVALDSLDCTGNPATLDGSNSSGAGTLTYEWQNVNGDSLGEGVTNEVDLPGVYILIIIDSDNGCTSSTSVEVSQNIDPPVAEAEVSGDLTCAVVAVTLDGSGSSGNGTISYEWQDETGNTIGVTEMADADSVGTYTLIITDSDNGCTASTTIEVGEDIAEPDPVAEVDGPLTCIDLEATLDGSGSSGTGTITYEWFDINGDLIGMEATVDVSDTETYTLIITDDANGCTSETTINATEDIQAPDPNITADGPLTCIDTEVELDGSGSSGTGTITYEWVDANDTSLGTDPTTDVSDTDVYTLVITDDANGCTAEIDFNADEDLDAPDPVAVIDDILTCDLTTVTLDGNGSSGAGNLTYEWLDALGNSLGTDPTVDVSDTEIYTLVITDDSNGCTAETDINADQNIVEPISDAGDDAFITCSDSETTLNGEDSSTGNDYTYEWINEGDVTVGTDIMVDVSETGIYTLIVTDETNGCTSSSTVEVLPDADLPVADAGEGATLTCSEIEVSLDGNGSSSGANISYEWFDPADVSLGSDLNIVVDVVGTFVLVVTNSDNGCTATSSVEVDEDVESPNAELNDIPNITCADSSVIVSAVNNGGDLYFEWLDSNGSQIGIGDEVTINETSEYTLMVTNLENGCSAIAIFEVMPDTLAPVADAGLDGLLTCDSTVYTLDGSNSSGGNLTYEWFDINGSIGDDAVLDVSTIGVYTLIVTNPENGCTQSSDVEVTEDVEAPIADAGEDLLLNCNISIVTLDGVNSSGGVLEYEWQDDMGNTIEMDVITEVVDPGDYVLIITNTNNGCTANDLIEVTGDFETPVVDPGIASLLTCTDTLATLDGSASTASGTMEFEWQDENDITIGMTSMVDVNNPGSYTLIVTNIDNGCTQEAEIIIDQNIVAPTSNAGQDASLTCDETEVTLTGSGTSQSGNTIYEWQNENGAIVGNTPGVQVSEIGTYTLIIADDANGCTAVSTVAVIPDANLPVADAGMSFTLTCSDTVVTLDGSNSSAGANINYEWQDSNGGVLGDFNAQEVNAPGIYTLIVTDTDNGCSATSTVEIFQNIEPPIADAGLNETLTCDETEVILDGGNSTVNSGVITNYDWFDENGMLLSTFAIADVTEPGTYTLVITGSNGCTAADQVEVLLDANTPEAVIGPGGLLTCETTSIDLGEANSNSGLNVTYSWTDSNGNFIDDTPTIQISNPDTYTLLVTNVDNNCETIAELQILQDTIPPDADAGVDATLTCELTQYELGGTGTSSGVDYSYEWQDGNNQMFDDQITTTIFNPGDYTLIVSNTENGCTAVSMVNITQDTIAPNADAGPDGILTCDVTEVTLDGSNSTGMNLVFEWQNEAGVVLDNIPSIEVSETGEFTLIVTNTQNSCSSQSTVMITPDANLPMVVATPDGIITCEVDMINIDGSASSSISGNISFAWEDEVGSPISSQNNIDVITPGVYTLIVTDDDNGCSASTQVEVLEDITPPFADAGPEQTMICGQTEATLTGSGSNGTNLIFEWQDDQTNPIGSTASIEVTTTGTYTLIVTNTDNGCSTSSTVDITPDTNLPTAEAGAGATLTCETTAVTLNGSGSDQGSNFEYEWQDELGNVISTELIFDVNDPGTYILFVLNTDNNCVQQDQVIIGQDINDPTAFADYGSAQSLDCNNTAITLDGSGSSPFGDLTFLWDTDDGNITSGATTINPEINVPGTYTLTVTNQTNGCTDTQQITVGQDITPPLVLIENPDLITCAITEITLDASNSSTNGNYTYSWSGTGIVSGGNSLEPVVNQSGDFTLTILNNDNGCESEADINVAENTTPPIANAAAEDEFDCLTESVSLDGTGSSSGAEFTYTWTGTGQIDNPNSLNPTVYQAGVYTLLVTDESNGCTQSTNTTVLEDTNVPTSLDLFVENPLCFGDQGSISVLSINGGNAPYLYSLDAGENFSPQNFFTNLDPGNYDLVIQDANGCEYSESVFIPGEIEVEVVVEPEVLIELGQNYELQAIVNIPVDEIDTIIWTPTEGLSCSDCLNPTVDIDREIFYTITVINENGCSDTDQIIVRVEKDRNVYIPNVFTPDNDGINDIFMIYSGGRQVKEINSFQVFDRWGELLFEDYNFHPNNPAHGWDGRLKDQPLNPGVFVYWAQVEFIDGEQIIFKGDVTISR